VCVGFVLAVWSFYGQNGQNFANFRLSITLQVPKLTNSTTRYLKGVPLHLIQKGFLVCEL
jgi:hypothetical protein